MSRPEVDPKIRELIARIWRSGIKTGPAIHKQLIKNNEGFTKKGEPSMRIPSVRTIQDIIKPLPQKSAEAEKDRKNPDRPWSLGASANESWAANPEVNRLLLDIWKWCKIVGRPFTVREAKWVALLRGTEDYKYLLGKAEDYAAREWACEVLGPPFDTTDLDARIMFPTPWEHDAAKVTGAVPKGYTIYDDIGKLQQEHEKTPGVFSMQPPDVCVEEKLIRDDLYELLRRKDDKSKHAYITYQARLKEIRTETLNSDEQVVYALWLRKISDTSIWPTLSLDQKLQTYEKLRDDVRKETQNRMGKPIHLQVSPFEKPWNPTELLKKFGLD